jgi:hypothetical protein
MPRARLAAGLLLFAPLLSGAPNQTPFDHAFERLYNFDFSTAHSIVDGYISVHPQEPLPYAIRASAHLFTELDRLGILEGEFFADDKRIIEKKKLKPDPNVRVRFLQSIQDAQSRAQNALAGNSNDRDALFTMAVAQGLATDYMALVEKRQIASLTPARQSNAYAQRLLRVDPNYYDAYLTTGFTEYIVGSIPFFIRWFIRFENISGSREKGIENVKIVAEKGRYLKPFGKILLAVAYLRDKRIRQSRDMLAELSRDYPSNPLFRKELARMETRIGAAGN